MLNWKSTLPLATLLTPALIAAAPHSMQRPFLVVVDPGHGGGDRGAVHRLSQGELAEKDMTLLLAHEVANQLRSRGMRAILTRREDLEVAITERTAIANRLGADVFLSIHMNSAGHLSSKTAQGFETFVLNTSSDASSRRLADLENAVLEGSVAAGFQKNEVGLIVKDLLLDGNRTFTHRLACLIQSKLSHTRTAVQSRNRGVKQALFYVLFGADMPSVLVEAGFIDNPSDRLRILNPSGRAQVASAIALAIAEFRDSKNQKQSNTQLSKCKIH